MRPSRNAGQLGRKLDHFDRMALFPRARFRAQAKGRRPRPISAPSGAEAGAEAGAKRLRQDTGENLINSDRLSAN
jgi:hypothetical protein